MENRPERPVAVRPRRLRPLALVLGIAAIGLCAGYLLLRSGEDSFYTEPAPVSAHQADAAPSSAGGTSPPAAAVIVDAAPETGATPFSSSETEPAAGSAAAIDNPSDAVAIALAAAAASPAANAKPVSAAATATTGASARKRNAATPAASTPRAAGGKDSDLLATLLKNIERDDPVATRAAAQRGDQSAMDELVQKIQNQNGASAQRSPDVQALLKQCPRANTTKGLLCRQKVCSKFAGLDPACPAL